MHKIIAFLEAEDKRISPSTVTVPSSIPTSLSNWIVDSPKDIPPILLPPVGSTSHQHSSSSLSAIRPMPIFATSTLNPGSLNTHPNPGGILPLTSNPPPIRPIPTSQLTTALHQQLLPNSYLHGVYAQQGTLLITFKLIFIV